MILYLCLVEVITVTKFNSNLTWKSDIARKIINLLSPDSILEEGKDLMSFGLILGFCVMVHANRAMQSWYPIGQHHCIAGFLW